jgi:hypothetical protein
LANLSASVISGGTINAISSRGTASSPRKTSVIAKPRLMCAARKLTGPERATARNVAIRIHEIGRRRR